MLDTTTKKRIDDARDILVGKIPDPKSQVEQITIALIYKFMDDMDTESEDLGGTAKFFVGDYKKYSWRRVFNKTRGGQEILLDYREALQKMSENPSLPTIFHTIFRQAYLPYNDPETLKEFLKIIDQFNYDHSEKLGDAFEYLLSVLGSQGDAGQFRTPRHIIDFMVDIVDPKKNETILDPACGTAGFLISAYKHILKNNSTKGKRNGDLLTPDERKRLCENISGYDISPDMVRLSLVNMYLHRITDPKIVEYDTLTSEARWNEYFDVIFANPPFMSPKGGIKPHSRFSVQSKRSEALFVDYIVEHLTTTGRGAVIVPEGVIFKSDSAFIKLRKMLEEDNYLYGVISLPSGVFNPYSGVKTSILLFDKVVAKLTDKILFAKVENDGFSLGAQRRPIDGNQLDAIASMIKEYRIKLHRGEKFTSELCTLVEKNKITESGDYNLSGERYFSKVTQSSLSYPMVNINDVCDLKRGTPLSSKDFDQSKDAVIPVIAGGQRPAGYHNESNRPENCITVSCSGAYAGFLSYHKTPIFATDCFTITPKSEELLDVEYLYPLLKTRQAEIYRFQTGMGQPHVSPKDFADFKIPLPSIEEQRAIVTEIERYQKIIDAARIIADNYLPQITIAPSWQMVKLGEVCDIKSGGTPSREKPEYWGGNIPWVKTGEINYNIILKTEETITRQGLENSSAKIIPQNTILMAMYGQGVTRGKVAILGINAAINQACAAFSILDSNKIINNYLYIILQSKYDLLRAISESRGGNQSNLSTSLLKSILIPLPDLDTQKQIVAQIEQEQAAVDSAKKLIEIFEKKVANRIAQIWNE